MAGFARIDGREVAIVSNDFTVLGASSSVINMKKIKHVKSAACRYGMPLVFLGESSGARMPDRMGAAGRAILAQDPTEYQRLRETPWVATLMGQCYGSSTWYAAMSDFVVMRKGSVMAIASPNVTSIAIGKPVDPEELGGWKLLTGVSGLADMAVDTDEQVLDAVKKFLSYMPAHAMEAPPEQPVPAGSDDACRKMLDIVPESRNQVYDVRKVIAAVVDTDSSFELKERYGRSVATVLARLDGKSVGFIANNPLFKGGALDADACQKATSFMVLCDSFNIPHRVPGGRAGVPDRRRRGTARHAGQGHQLDERVDAWSPCRASPSSCARATARRSSTWAAAATPTSSRAGRSADLGFMDPRVSVNVLYGVKEAGRPGALQATRRRGQPRHHAVGAGAAVRGAARHRPARHARLPHPHAAGASQAAEERRRRAPAGELAHQLLDPVTQ